MNGVAFSVSQGQGRLGAVTVIRHLIHPGAWGMVKHTTRRRPPLRTARGQAITARKITPPINAVLHIESGSRKLDPRICGF